jgi:hypothetical protein
MTSLVARAVPPAAVLALSGVLVTVPVWRAGAVRGTAGALHACTVMPVACRCGDARHFDWNHDVCVAEATEACGHPRTRDCLRPPLVASKLGHL